MKNDEKILAVNVANCLIPKSGISAEKYLESKSTEGALQSIKALTNKFGRVVLIYKTSKDSNMVRIAEWLKHNAILSELELQPCDVVFVDDAPKLHAVLKKLKITHMVHDDVFFAGKVTGLDKVVLLDNKPYPTKLTPDEKRFMEQADCWVEAQKILEKNVSIKQV